jgi:hypothetical protein
VAETASARRPCLLLAQGPKSGSARWPLPSWHIPLVDASQRGCTELFFKLVMCALIGGLQVLNQRLGVCDQDNLMLFNIASNDPCEGRQEVWVQTGLVRSTPSEPVDATTTEPQPATGTTAFHFLLPNLEIASSDVT